MTAKTVVILHPFGARDYGIATDAEADSSWFSASGSNQEQIHEEQVAGTAQFGNGAPGFTIRIW